MQAEQPKRGGVSIRSWMGAQFLFAIPVVNIIALIIWAITAPNRTKRNYCIAALIWIVILIVVAVLLLMFFGPQIVEWSQRLNTALTT